MSEKLQKILARVGLGSRRQIEAWIAAGRVKVNGEIAKIGMRISGNAKIVVDDRFVNWQEPLLNKRRVLLYHKPEGEVCTRADPEGRPTVFTKFPPLRQGRWIAIGRLDINTSGLLLVANDGELAHRLLHPSFEIEREYAIRVLGQVTHKTLEKLQKGVKLEDGLARFSKITEAGGSGANHWYHVVLQEGRNREARRLWESQGITVSRLIRIRFGCIQLPRELAAGKWEELSIQEIKQLATLVGL